MHTYPSQKDSTIAWLVFDHQIVPLIRRLLYIARDKTQNDKTHHTISKISIALPLTNTQTPINGILRFSQAKSPLWEQCKGSNVHPLILLEISNEKTNCTSIFKFCLFPKISSVKITYRYRCFVFSKYYGLDRK